MDFVKKRRAQYDNPPTNVNELWSRVQTEWVNILHRTIEVLVESMPEGIKSVIKAKFLWTKYKKYEIFLLCKSG